MAVPVICIKTWRFESGDGVVIQINYVHVADEPHAKTQRRKEKIRIPLCASSVFA
jgi:hypothetical protein